MLKTETNGFPKGLKGRFCFVLFSSTVIDFIVGESHWFFPGCCCNFGIKSVMSVTFVVIQRFMT